MGCACCLSEDITDEEFEQIIKDVYDEYQLYMQFLYKLKNDLNSSIFSDKHSNNNINNQTHSKEFYIIPRIWFDNWEKRIEIIIKHNMKKSVDFNFKVKNFDNWEKSHYELFIDELWVKINRNKSYKINEGKKLKSLICNNLIILNSAQNSYYIEIFFFKNDEDLYLTDLLFSFDKCNDKIKEYNDLLKLLQKSPIQEIFGNIHYDYSEIFFEKKKKYIIYNKTGNINEEIKNFRKEQFKLFLSKEKENENENRNEEDEKEDENENINEEIIINDYKKNNNDNNKNVYESYTKITKNRPINQRKEGNILRGNELSRASTNMMFSRVSTNMMVSNQNIGNVNINNNTINNISNIKIYKSKEAYDNDQQKYNDQNNNNIIRSKPTNCKMNLLSNNENEFSNSRNLYLKSCKETSTLMDCNYKGKDYINDCNEDIINKSFFESIIYCLFNIKELTNFVLNKKYDENLQNSFYNNYFNIIQFLSNKNKNLNIKGNEINNISGYESNIFKDCPNFNYQELLKLIIYQEIYNPISMIINKLHTELNTNKSKENVDSLNEDNHNYDNFCQKCKEKNNSIIFDLFYGIKEIKTICYKCHKESYDFEIMNILEFTDKIAKYYKEKENSNNIIQISIEDCLNYYKNSYSETLYDFQFCKKHQEYSIFYDIRKYPEILIIDFNNNNEEIKENFKIKINTELNIINDKYELIGIISIKYKKKDKNEDNIFISYCKDFLNEKWLVYDESKVVDYNLIENINKIEPIVLFYQKIKKIN